MLIALRVQVFQQRTFQKIENCLGRYLNWGLDKEKFTNIN